MSGVPFAGGGFLGSGGKVQTSAQETRTNAATGLGIAEGDQSSVISGLVAADGASITIADPESVRAGRDVALRSLDLAEDSIADLLTRAGDAAQAARSTTQQAIESSIGLASQFQRSDDERSAGEFRKLVTVLAVAVGAIFAVQYFAKG